MASTSPISFDAWLSKFPDQQLAERVKSYVTNDDFTESPESFIYQAITAYYEAQKEYNLNPEHDRILKLLSDPIIGALIDKAPGIKSQKTTYSLQFEQDFAITPGEVGSWTEPRP